MVVKGQTTKITFSTFSTFSIFVENRRFSKIVFFRFRRFSILEGSPSPPPPSHPLPPTPTPPPHPRAWTHTLVDPHTRAFGVGNRRKPKIVFFENRVFSISTIFDFRRFSSIAGSPIRLRRPPRPGKGWECVQPAWGHAWRVNMGSRCFRTVFLGPIQAKCFSKCFSKTPVFFFFLLLGPRLPTGQVEACRATQTGPGPLGIV